MTSPDLPTAVNLTVHQVTETDLLDSSIASFQSRVPEWAPGEGDTEVVLMEAMAVIVGQDVYAINQIARVNFDGLIQLWGVSRQAGLKAAATVRGVIGGGATGGRVLPSATRFRVARGDGSTIDLLTTDPVTINPADATFTATVLAENPGTFSNGLLPNTVAVPVVPLAWLDSATLFTATAGGTDLESDPQFYARAAMFFRAQTSMLGLAQHFESASLATAGIGRARAVNMYKGTGGTFGADLGHVTVGVTTSDGSAPSQTVRDAMQAGMQARAIAGLQVHVIGPTLVDYPLAVTVDAQPGQDKPALQAAVLAMLRGWISPISWPWGGVLYSNDVVTRVGTYPGVLRVTAVSGVAVGRAVTDPLQLPSATSTLAVTVNP